MTEHTESYTQKCLDQALRELAGYAERDRQRDRAEAQAVLDAEAALLQVVDDRQTQERTELLAKEQAAWLRSCWTSHVISNSKESDHLTFNPLWLGPAVDAAMAAAPGAYPPGSSAVDAISPHEVLAKEHPISHIGEVESSFSRMLKDLK
jgi:hypothetical protein